MNKSDLKRDLRAIKKNDLDIPENIELTYEAYAKEMLFYIGDKDSELRDGLIYEVFAQWIDQDRFSETQLNEYLKVCLDDQHLMYCVGEEAGDNVYTRTFSALIIAAILHKHNESNFLSEEVLHQAMNQMIEYYGKEIDLRGCIKDGGWAHSAAHGADVFGELTQCTVFTADDLLRMLQALRAKVCQGYYVFIDREPERISVPVRNILERNLLKEVQVRDWLTHFLVDPVQYDVLESYHKLVNIQNFYKTLYFALKEHDRSCSFLPMLEGLISRYIL